MKAIDQRSDLSVSSQNNVQLNRTMADLRQIADSQARGMLGQIAALAALQKANREFQNFLTASKNDRSEDPQFTD